LTTLLTLLARPRELASGFDHDTDEVATPEPEAVEAPV